MPHKILIIGAGIAGLAACRQLSEYGFDVKILEARSYTGGRICTDHTLGIPLGRGASWIHGTDGNPITELAKEFHATLVTVNFQQFRHFDRNNVLISQDKMEQFNAKFTHFLEKAKQLAFTEEQDISLYAALTRVIHFENLTEIEQDLFKKKLTSYENYVGANAKNLSARHWDQEKTWPGENCFMTSSYQPILDGLARNCQIELNTPVTEIHMREKDVQVITENAIFTADAVLITVPLGVLKKKSIIFHPKLSSEKQNAIDRLGMGLLNITALRFPHAFWPKASHALLYTQTDNASISVFFNLHHFIEEPILIGFSGGDKGRKLEELNDAELIENTMNDLKKVYGSDIPAPISYFHTRWSQDPYAYGAYSYVAKGATGEDYEILARPIANRIFFAGEATHSEYPATTHGAYLSGIRGAVYIKNSFS